MNFSPILESCASTLPDAGACVAGMENDGRDKLVSAMVLEAGRLMEDLTPDLAMVMPTQPEARLARLRAFQQRSEDCTVLLSAAVVLNKEN